MKNVAAEKPVRSRLQSSVLRSDEVAYKLIGYMQYLFVACMNFLENNKPHLRKTKIYILVSNAVSESYVYYIKVILLLLTKN